MAKKIALIGSGHIARDLYRKIKFSNELDLILVASKNLKSEGLVEAKKFSRTISDKGINAILENSEDIDVVIDCSSASSHKIHAPLLSSVDLPVIDMTPSGIGRTIIPTVNLHECKKLRNINLVSCGGQSSIPILYKWKTILNKHGLRLSYVEVASTISTLSAGMATRRNLDNYLKNTEKAITEFCDCEAKVILNVNPAVPPVTMRTSFSALIDNPYSLSINWTDETNEVESLLQRYIPGYKITVNPQLIDDKRLFSSALIRGRGDYLPDYSGNLDIITSAAIVVAKSIVI